MQQREMDATNAPDAEERLHPMHPASAQGIHPRITIIESHVPLSPPSAKPASPPAAAATHLMLRWPRPLGSANTKMREEDVPAAIRQLEP